MKSMTTQDIATIQQAMLDGTLTAAQLVATCLQRIEQWDGQGPKLAAMLAINPHAQAVAQEQDTAAQSGKLVGPLHGIPIVLKDNCNTSDMPTTAASQALAGFTPSKDSAVAQRLKAAGAIIIGKANLHEFALAGLTMSSLGGQTLNPYDLTRTPGGSSGGSAVAVAMGYGTLAIGTDTVNSIRSPASATNLVGLRPTRGLVSRAGCIPVADSQDTVGPIAHSVADLARTMDVLAGYDPNDAVTALSVGRIPASYTDSLGQVALSGKRIGLLTSLQGTDAHNQPVNAAMQAVIKVFEQAGATVVTVDDTSIDADALIEQLDVQKWEFKPLMNRCLAQEPEAPVKDLAGLIASGRCHESIQDFLKLAEAVEDPENDLAYVQRRLAHQRLRHVLWKHMADQELDALMYPLQRCLVVPVGEASQVERNGILAALTGFPAINLRAGFSQPDTNAPVGVPIGFDLMARPFDDVLLLGMGYAYEQLTPHLKQGPDLRQWQA